MNEVESIYGKNKVVLKLNDQIENIVFSLFKKEQLKGTEKLYIKYKISETKEDVTWFCIRFLDVLFYGLR